MLKDTKSQTIMWQVWFSMLIHFNGVCKRWRQRENIWLAYEVHVIQDQFLIAFT